MTLAEIFRYLIDHVYALWPVRIVRDWEQGVRLFAGRIHSEPLTSTNGWWGSGIHAFWPILGEFLKYLSNIDVIETPIQTVRCGDGKEITFSLGLRYKVDDAAAFYLKIYDDQSTVSETCRSAASVVAGRLGVADFCLHGPGEDGQIAREARKQMHGWGVRVIRVQLINVTTAQSLRLIQDVPRTPTRQEAMIS